jgi:two-component system, NtrC family, sensor histidine kinase HydH
MKRDESHSNGAPSRAGRASIVARWEGRLRWVGAALGILASIGDTASLKMLGTSFAINGRDVTTLTAAWFGLSFAALGYLLGDAIDGRLRERRASELIRTQMETINESRAKLIQNEKLAALGQLASAIAHEVRNPLAVIRSAAQNLRDTVPAGDADARRACTFITEESDRLGNLINALLAFARPLHISPVRVPIAELFERTVVATSEETSAKHVRVERPAQRELGAISVDPDLMTQVFVGLVANAIEAVAAGGEVRLEVQPDHGRVELAVADSGPGVPPELRKRVFEPFFTTRAEGIGLGLAIARQIVEAHGGSIEVGKSDAGGARFAVILPALDSAATAAA